MQAFGRHTRKGSKYLEKFSHYLTSRQGEKLSGIKKKVSVQKIFLSGIVNQVMDKTNTSVNKKTQQPIYWL